MELRLGAPVLAGDTPEVMISSVARRQPRLAASIFPRLLTHADGSRSIPHGPAGPRRGDGMGRNLLVDATRLRPACTPGNHKYLRKKKRSRCRVRCYYTQYPGNTQIHPRAAVRPPAKFPCQFHYKTTFSRMLFIISLSLDLQAEYWRDISRTDAPILWNSGWSPLWCILALLGP